MIPARVTSLMVDMVRPSRRAVRLFSIAGRQGWRGGLARQLLLILHACDVSAGARFGSGLRLPHPIGIVVGSGCVVGSDVTICQGVTLGHNQGRGYPVLEDGVKVYPNSTLVGPIRIGAGAVVGANCLVVRNVPKRATVKGTPSVVISDGE